MGKIVGIFVVIIVLFISLFELKFPGLTFREYEVTVLARLVVMAGLVMIMVVRVVRLARGNGADSTILGSLPWEAAETNAVIGEDKLIGPLGINMETILPEIFAKGESDASKTKVISVEEKPLRLDGSVAMTKRLEIFIEGYPEPFIVFLNHGMGGIGPNTPITKERWGANLLRHIERGKVKKRVLVIETADGILMHQFDLDEEAAADEEARIGFYE